MHVHLPFCTCRPVAVVALTASRLPCLAVLLATSRPRVLQLLISDMCSRLEVDGLRGDIVINRAVKALVAWEGRKEVTVEDVERIIPSCLNHRCAQVAACVLSGRVGGWEWDLGERNAFPQGLGEATP